MPSVRKRLIRGAIPIAITTLQIAPLRSVPVMVQVQVQVHLHLQHQRPMMGCWVHTLQTGHSIAKVNTNTQQQMLVG